MDTTTSNTGLITKLAPQKTMYGQTLEAKLTEIEGIPEGAEERKFLVDTKNPITRAFEKHGHKFYRVYVMNARRKWTPESGIKYWEQFNEKTGLYEYRKALPFSTPVYPFEQLEEDLREMFEKEMADINKEIKSSKFEIVRRDYSHNGFTAYWTLLSDIRKVVKGSYVKDDVVQLGLTIRNGIYTGVALGADYYTYRLQCENGAIGRGDNFGSVSIRHVGDQEKMIQTFKQGIPIVIKLGEKIVDYYTRATKIMFNDRMAQYIHKRTGIGDRYFPDYFHIDNDQKELEKKVTLTREGRNVTLWEVFNDLTEPLTRSLNQPDYHLVKGKEKRTIHLGFSSFGNRTRALHKSLMNILDNRVNKIEVA